MFEIEASPIQVSVFGRTDPGQVRSDNQDSFLIAELDADGTNSGVLVHPETNGPAQAGSFMLGPKGALLLVADGMGGAAAGGLASKLAVVEIYQEMISRWGADRNQTPRQFALRLREAVEQANARIHQEAKANPDFRGMGTTATLGGILDGFLYLAQVGDSRAYLVRNGEARQLTRDQSLVQELIEAGTLTEEEAERSDRRNLILQALGSAPEVKVDLTYQELRRGDTVLLCSDGLCGQVRRQEIARAVNEVPDVAALCEHLIQLANSRGGPDNITVVVARFNGAGLESPREGDPVGRQVFTLD